MNAAIAAAFAAWFTYAAAREFLFREECVARNIRYLEHLFHEDDPLGNEWAARTMNQYAGPIYVVVAGFCWAKLLKVLM